jgi:hypothetical protein
MALTDITSQAILDAVAEYDRLGQDAFLHRYGFGAARKYFLVHNGQEYASKAVVGVAHGYQFPDQGPLQAGDFRGGYATVQPLLESLGFNVRVG